MNEQIKFYESKLDFEMDASDLFHALNEGEKIVVIDARQRHGFDNEHIPNAVNLPHREMNKESTKDFDRNILYVTYCDGIGCNASTKGALKMTILGFKVKELLGGIEWWKFDGYATEGRNARKGLEIECAC
jgi:rhodanese-related sulfurtransferase